MKRIMLIVFVCMLFFSCSGEGSSGTLSAQSTTTLDQFGLRASRIDGIAGIIITSYNGSGGAVTIPREINGIPVRAIGNEAFSGRKIFSVTIPDSVISIGNNAFSNNLLRNVTIPNSVTSIGEEAFRNNLITSISIPNSVTSMHWNAILSDNLLTSITIGANVQRFNIWGGANNEAIYNNTAGTFTRTDLDSSWVRR